jgi:hypothetical protein
LAQVKRIREILNLEVPVEAFLGTENLSSDNIFQEVA